MVGQPCSYGVSVMMRIPMFEGSISLPQNPREAALIAENLEALARALREWPADTWQKVGTAAAAEPEGSSAGLFERLLVRAAPAALDSRQRTQAVRSAEAAAGVLRVLWPTVS